MVCAARQRMCCNWLQVLLVGIKSTGPLCMYIFGMRQVICIMTHVIRTLDGWLQFSLVKVSSTNFHFYVDALVCTHHKCSGVFTNIIMKIKCLYASRYLYINTHATEPGAL